MGCSHSELLLKKNAIGPGGQLLERDRGQMEPDSGNTALTQDQLERVQVVWKLIGDEKEFLTLVMIKYCCFCMLNWRSFWFKMVHC